MRRRCGPGQPGRRSTSTGRSPSGTPPSGWAPAAALDSMEDAGVLGGDRVSDRYQNYFRPRWDTSPGTRRAFLTYCVISRDCARATRARSGPVQAQRALRGLHAHLGTPPASRAWTPPRRRAEAPGRELLEFCGDRRSDVLLFAEDTAVLAHEQYLGARSLKTRRRNSPAAWPATTSAQDRLDIRSYIDTARKHGKDVWNHVCHNLMLGRPWRPPAPGILPVTTEQNPRCLSPHVNGLNVYSPRLAASASA